MQCPTFFTFTLNTLHSHLQVSFIWCTQVNDPSSIRIETSNRADLTTASEAQPIVTWGSLSGSLISVPSTCFHSQLSVCCEAASSIWLTTTASAIYSRQEFWISHRPTSTLTAWSYESFFYESFFPQQKGQFSKKKNILMNGQHSRIAFFVLAGNHLVLHLNRGSNQQKHIRDNFI